MIIDVDRTAPLRDPMILAYDSHPPLTPAVTVFATWIFLPPTRAARSTQSNHGPGPESLLSQLSLHRTILQVTMSNFIACGQNAVSCLDSQTAPSCVATESTRKWAGDDPGPGSYLTGHASQDKLHLFFDVDFSPPLVAYPMLYRRFWASSISKQSRRRES